jgi:hypothetical protein
VDEIRIAPETLAGDPFYAAAHEEGRVCLCLEGFHYMGYEVETDGEIETAYVRLPCRRCSEAEGR